MPRLLGVAAGVVSVCFWACSDSSESPPAAAAGASAAAGNGQAGEGGGNTDGGAGEGGSAGSADAADNTPRSSCSCAPEELCVDGECRPRGTIAQPEIAECTEPPCINVFNNCPIPIWTHAVAETPVDEGKVRKLEPGEQWQYSGLPNLYGGRVYGYYKEPELKVDETRLVSDYNQFIEMTVDSDGEGNVAQNYNVSYVDYISLPVSVRAKGDCTETKCGASFEDWKLALKNDCPTDLRNQHEGVATCTGSYIYCITPDGESETHDTTKPYCSKMEDEYGFPGSDVYGGVFPEHDATEVDFWDGVAAWNRGTTAGDADDANYYVNEPYNHYAAWIHRDLNCGYVYAFSTDDHQDKAGFVRCVSPELDVVWCPYD